MTAQSTSIQVILSTIWLLSDSCSREDGSGMDDFSGDEDDWEKRQRCKYGPTYVLMNFFPDSIAIALLDKV